MHSLIKWLHRISAVSVNCFLLLSLPVTASLVTAATFFVAPDGKNTNPGTKDESFATMQQGHDEAKTGGTIVITSTERTRTI